MTTVQVQQYAANDDKMPDEDAKNMARSHLAGKAYTMGRVLDGDVTRSEPQAVIVNAAMDGWDDCDDDDPRKTGVVYTWTGETVEPIRDPEPLPGRMDGTAYVVDLPEDHMGGPVRCRHGLGGPVTVAAIMREGFTGGGILVSTPITDDEEHVETFPGVASLRMVRDEVT